MTIPYAVFEAASGAVIRWGVCPAGDLPHQAVSGDQVARQLPEPVDPAHPPTLQQIEQAS